MKRDECQHGQLRRQCEICELIAERDALRARIESAPVYVIPKKKPTTSEGWGLIIESVKNLNAMRGKRVRLVVE